MVLIKAMLCSWPSITKDVGIAPDWVVEQNIEFIADAPTSKSIGAALERAWSSRATRTEWELRHAKAYSPSLTASRVELYSMCSMTLQPKFTRRIRT